MDIYEKIVQDNGDILLNKIIYDKNQYKLIKQDDNYILKLIKYKKINNINQLKQYNFTKSVIIDVNINKEFYTEKKNYFQLLVKIYKIINSGSKIIKNSKLNINTIELNDRGFTYIQKLGISVQYADANRTIYEIMHQLVENNIEFDIKIQLQNNEKLNLSSS